VYKIALVGKPNVGKSTLFNRIINKKHAIVDDQPGVTRDRLLANATWLNKSFIIIDTGGLTNKEIPFQQNIEQQVKFAIAESNAIIFLVSAKERINQEDYYIAKLLKKYKGKQILLVVNKTENLPQQNINQYYSLGFGEPLFIASEHGIGIGDLLDQIIKPIKVNSAVKVVNNSFCVIGRTNVGKSTLVNTILREERVLVSPIPHTTRDSVDVTFKYDNQSFTIIDTAGIRRKGKITDNIEKYAVMRTQQAIERSQTIIFLLDGNSQISEQDEVIGGLAYEKNIPTIICVNKWDKVKKNQSTMNETTKLIRQRFKYLS
jgi:GTP-binding protein